MSSGKISFLVFSEIIDSAAPVSISILNGFPFALTSIVMGSDDLVPTLKRWNSSGAVPSLGLRSSLSLSTHFVSSFILRRPREGAPRGLDRQTVEMLPQTSQTASLK